MRFPQVVSVEVLHDKQLTISKCLLKSVRTTCGIKMIDCDIQEFLIPHTICMICVAPSEAVCLIGEPLYGNNRLELDIFSC